MSRYGALWLLLCLLPAWALADAVAEPPAGWQGRLAGIPAQQLDDLQAADRSRIREVRTRLDALLADPSSDPHEVAAAYGRLAALYQAADLSSAAALGFADARLLDPGAFRWAYYDAHLALSLGQAQRGLDALAAAAALNPAYPPLALRRGEALLGLNRLEEARAAYAEAARDPELRAAALYGIANVDLLQRNWEAAAAGLEQVLALQPGASAVHYPLGQALLRLGRRREARAHLSQRGMVKPHYPDPLVAELEALQSRSRYHFERAMDAVNRGEHAAALDDFAAGLAAAPDNANARISYARALYVAGQQARARAELERALEIEPGAALAHFLLAVMDDAAGREEAAVRGYRRVLEIDPGHQGALSYLANLELREGRFGQARADYERAIAAGAHMLPLHLHHWAALALSGPGDARLAEALDGLVARFPESPTFRALQVRLLASSEDPAVRDPRRALELATRLIDDHNVPPHWELKALALAATGDLPGAVEIQERLVKLAEGGWAPPAELERLRAALAAYRAGRLPPLEWREVLAFVLPGPPDPEIVMRNYPGPKPY